MRPYRGEHVPGHDPMHDEAAADRLRAEVERRYREHTGERFTKSGLSERASIGRPTLDNWLERGVMPPPEGMARLAEAVGVPAAQLWIRWLDLGMAQPALERIADALERAYPPDLGPVGISAGPVSPPSLDRLRDLAGGPLPDSSPLADHDRPGKGSRSRSPRSGR